MRMPWRSFGTNEVVCGVLLPEMQGSYTPYPATFRQGILLDDEREWGVVENRCGNLKREIVEEDETPGESFRDSSKD